MVEIVTRVSRKQNIFLVRFVILYGINNQFHTILGKRDCIELKLFKLLDNDAISPINTISNDTTKQMEHLHNL